MNILAVDTSTKKASVTIKKDEEVISKYVDNEITHSEKLLPLIDEVLYKANLSLNDIDSLACIEGPGSFTGVRIGVATIKAIAKVLDKKIVGTTSLKLMAMSSLKEYNPKYVLALMDAKNDRVYFELFENTNGTLSSTTYLGNNYIESVIRDISDKDLDNLLITVDSDNLKNIINLENINVLKVDLDLENIFDIIDKEPEYTYLDLDAKYYRKSEAERTKDGE